MADDLWYNFVQSGNVIDYLKYKQNQNDISLKAQENAVYDKGLDNKRTDNR